MWTRLSLLSSPPSPLLHPVFVIPPTQSKSPSLSSAMVGDGAGLSKLPLLKEQKKKKRKKRLTRVNKKKSGSKRWYCQVGQELSKRGITCVTINYTLYPEGVCEDIVGDMELAVRFVAEQLPLIWKQTGHWKHELQQTQDDPDNEDDGNANDVHLVPRICLMGHSAGGHVALQYAFVRHPNFAALQMHHKDTLAVYDEALKSLLPDDGSSLLRDSRRVASLVDSVICLSAVFSITKHFEIEKKRGIDNISKMKDVMGGPSKFDGHSPLELLQKFLQEGSDEIVVDFGEDKELTRPLKVRFVHGTNDTTIPIAASKDMFDLLQSVSGSPKDVLCGGPVSYVPLTGCNHTQIIFHLMGSSLRFSSDLFLAVTSIFD